MLTHTERKELVRLAKLDVADAMSLLTGGMTLFSGNSINAIQLMTFAGMLVDAREALRRAEQRLAVTAETAENKGELRRINA